MSQDHSLGWHDLATQRSLSESGRYCPCQTSPCLRPATPGMLLHPLAPDHRECERDCVAVLSEGEGWEEEEEAKGWGEER